MNEQSLFQEALSRSPEERAAFLEQACAGRREYLAAVLALLAAHEKSGNILDRPPAPTADSGPGVAQHAATLDGTRRPADASSAATSTADFASKSEAGIVVVGRYTLQQKIGSGGMGEVWVAKQTEPVKRKVALKLIKTGMDSKAVLQRFEQERQALAMMDHPNIARVLDGGLTPTGQPFFVMELVNGLPLTKFCDEARLTPKDRLELFVPICQAVQHAHQKGIIHRDLKPANILITIIDGKPVPKVIDFGVAKAIAGKLTDESMSTQFGAVIGTLEYMSPEQAGFSGVDIDTRADIYSLGVILYELLTGLRPIDAKRLRNAALTEMIRIIREEEPSKPSTRLSTDDRLPSMAALRQTEPRKLMAMLRGELDWVVMKCLEKHRERRYETANGLARDIQRYLADEPVEARPPSTGYRFSKFLVRHRGPVLAASLVLLALVLGIVGTTFGMIRADRARSDEAKQRGIAEANEAKALVAAEAERAAKDREAEQRAKAEKARDRTRQALDAMTSSVTGDSLATQKEISDEQKKFLIDVLTYYREFAGEKADDEASRARTAAAAGRVGSIEYRLGRTAEAAAAIRLALDGYGKLAAEFSAMPEHRMYLAASYNNLGILVADLGQRPEAEKQYRKALAILEKLTDEFPAVPEYRRDLANNRNNLGSLLKDLGKRSEAEEQFRKALAIREKLAAEFPAVPEYRKYVAVSHSNLGIMLADLAKRPHAEEQHRKALAIQEELADEFPAMPEYRNDLARSHNNLGFLLASLGKRPQAEEQYQKSLAIKEKLVDEFPAVPEYRRELAQTHINLGNLQGGLRKGPEAEEQFWKAAAILEKLAADFPAVPEYRRGLDLSHNNLGLLLLEMGKRPEAEEQYRKTLAIEVKLAAEFPSMPLYRQALARSHNNLGTVLRDLGKLPEAEQQYRKALEIREKLVAEFPAGPERRNDLAGSHNNLGILLANLGKRPEAEEQYRKALAIEEKLVAEFPAVPEHRKDLAASNNNLASLLRDLGKRPEAEEPYRKALAILEKLVAEFPALPEYRNDLAKSHNSLGFLLAGLKKWPEAEEQYRKAVAIQEKLVVEFPAVPEYRKHLGGIQRSLGLRLADLGQRLEAEEPYRKALAIREKLVADFPAVPEHRKDLAASHNDLGLLLAGLGKWPEAEQQYRKALAVREKLVADFPAVPLYRVDLGGSYCNFGLLVSNRGQPGESLEWFEKAISTLTAVYEQDRRLVLARRFLCISHSGRARTYDRLRKFTEAIKDWDKAIELSPIAELPGARTGRATSRLQAGQVAEAVSEVDELTKNAAASSSANLWHNFACFYAIASAKIADKKQEYADRAMDLLRKAVKAGFNNAAHMATDTDLDPIRGRNDFKKLVEELGAKPG